MWTDGLIGGIDLAWAPGRFVSCGSHTPPGTMAPALVVRWDSFFTATNPAITPIDDPVGLAVDGELAALLSLATGARMRSGGPSRTFDGGDPHGRPLTPMTPPAWPGPAHSRSMIPVPEHGILERDIRRFFELYATCDRKTATVLATCAREYATALWMADSDPDLGWLLLVSALETAAVHHIGAAIPDPVNALRVSMPDVADRLESVGPDTLADVASLLKGLTGATQRFLAFIDKFPPLPPSTRPEQYGRVEWLELTDALKTIYRARSARLHQGTPFPAPMRTPPITHWQAVCEAKMPGTGPAPIWMKTHRPTIADAVLVERPTDVALANEACGRMPAKAAPMHLHTFADLTRRVLLEWATAVSRQGDW